MSLRYSLFLYESRGSKDYELPRYITQSTVTGLSTATTVNGSLKPSEGKFQSNSIQLSQVPDKLIIFVRKPLGSQTCKDADAFLTIKGISINWNNNSGLLSSATKQDLYRFSREAGYNGTWQEWSGKAWGASPAGGNGVNVPTSGSMLMLDFAKHIQLTEDWFSSGSLGNFNLQFSLDLENYSSVNYSATPAELVVITMNSGVFVCERGTSFFNKIGEEKQAKSVLLVIILNIMARLLIMTGKSLEPLLPNHYSNIMADGLIAPCMVRM
jgi:hypothetical protein